MMAVNTAKKPNSFSIDSLMAKDTDSREGSPVSARSPSPRETRPASSSPDRTPDRTHPGPRDPGPASGFQPVVPGLGAAAAAFLQGINGKLPGHHIDGHQEHLPMHFGAEGLTGLHPGLAHGGHMGLPNPLHCGAGSVPLGLAASSAQQMGMHHLLLGHHRESFGPYLPWFLSRHGNLLGHRFAGPDASLLLQPFRKPKRIRTAFSPSQLLRLEHAFEKNHYVVGQERKDLAANLSLTETQVKVWFQNRRTKYKRMKAENDEEGGGEEGRGSVSSPGGGRISPCLSEEMMESSDEEDKGEEGKSPVPAGQNVQRNKTSHHINRWRVETNQV